MQRRELLKTLAAGATTLGAVGSTAVVTQAAAIAATPKRAGDPIEQDAVKFWSESSLKRVYPNSDPGSAAPLDDPAMQTVLEHFHTFGDPYANAFLSAVPEPASVASIIVAAAGMTLTRRRFDQDRRP